MAFERFTKSQFMSFDAFEKQASWGLRILSSSNGFSFKIAGGGSDSRDAIFTSRILERSNSVTYSPFLGCPIISIISICTRPARRRTSGNDPCLNRTRWSTSDLQQAPCDIVWGPLRAAMCPYSGLHLTFVTHSQPNTFIFTAWTLPVLLAFHLRDWSLLEPINSATSRRF